ncbi:fumarylacetoacetate hydrolase family protein [Oceanobacillus profundus]|uniref:FAA hydrolase family protein n=1 Tax=Oceanobacillus profundus TaxID=372463 RepID=A0A417YNI1_9BACI|nr:fumarylacetoacetate hydrolase family protein [Oceanobacillus profundus]RHW35259.1 FAA hydrolase family protein [Oceanobacillus profundus]
MKTITFVNDSMQKLGVVTDKGILDIEYAVGVFSNQLEHATYPLSITELIEGGAKARNDLEQVIEVALSSNRSNLFLAEDSDIEYGPSVTDPQKILCIGLNYKKHAEESNMSLPEKPIVFSKFNNALCGHRAKINLPKNAKEFDYEGELAIVIAKEAKDVSKEDAMSYIYGYTIANDFSARDLQFQSPQWLLGKTSDQFCPIGPYLVTADEVADVKDLSVRTYVNKERRQDGNTAQMIFPCDEIISYLSKHMTLYPGDVILTGTPDGVIMGYEESEREWLKTGDEIVIEIEKIGRLSNELI